MTYCPEMAGRSSRSSSRKRSKFFVESLRAIRNQFRQIYRKCTCGLDSKIPRLDETCGEPTNLGNGEHFQSCRNDRCNGHGLEKMFTSCHHRVEQNLRYSHEDCIWILNRETEVNLGGIILPSPPPTPKISHPDGDFLCKDFSRPHSASYREFYRTSGSFRLTRTESEASLCHREEDHRCLQLPTLRTHSAISKLVCSAPPSRPGSRAGALARPKSRGGFSVNDSICRTSMYQGPGITSASHFPYNVNEYRRQRRSRCGKIQWKELPKSISLNINNGLVEAMFIPSWANELLRKAPFFQVVTKVINWTGIDIRHERAEQRLRRIEENRQKVSMFQKSIWNCRCLIGLFRRKLSKDEGMKADLELGLGTRFQLVYWLNESNNDVNSIGRYFDTEEKRLVAIKTVLEKPPPSRLEQLQLRVGALREIEALMQMDHVNVVRMLSYCEGSSKIHVIMEACDHSLRCEMTFCGNGADPVKAQGVIAQIINGLNHCHKKRCLHRNLSPDNILVTVSGVVKIADFSKAIFLCEKKIRPCLPGDICYGAPELLALDSHYDVSADVWSVGCILLEMLVGRLLWKGKTAEEQLLLIHKTVGPILPQHAAVAMISSKNYRMRGRCLKHHVPQLPDPICSVLESCLQVDPSKRISSSALLKHPFIMKGSGLVSAPEQPRQQQQQQQPAPVTSIGEIASLPRMALWEPQAEVCVQSSQSTDVSEMTKDLATTSPSDVKNQVANPRSILKSNITSSKKAKNTVAFSLASNSIAQLSSPASITTETSVSSHHGLFPESHLVKEQLLGVGTKSFWTNLKQISSFQTDPVTSESSSPILRRGNHPRRPRGREPLQESMIANGLMESAKPNNAGDQLKNEADSLTLDLPSGPRSRMQYLISTLPTANWSTVNLYTEHLKTAARKSPKAFSSYVEPLVAALLEQIADSKSKISGPAIRILNNICQFRSNLFEPEAERIMESMLNKLGGPSFIEKESTDVLRHIAHALTPSKAIVTIVKLGGNHRASAARLSTIQMVEDAVKKLDLISELGLPGEQTAPQRRLSNALFDIATRFLRDSSAQTRLIARNVYQYLMRHPGFWYLYQSTLPEEKRQWVNKLLEELRRCPPPPLVGTEKRNNNNLCNHNSSRNVYKPTTLV